MMALGAVLAGLVACQSDNASTAGVVPSTRFTYSDAIAGLKGGAIPEWFRLQPDPGVLLSADETYLREKAFGIAAPADEKILVWRRPIYVSETLTHFGPPVAEEQKYYVAQSYKWPASEEARVNILLADLHRANARLDDYSNIADHILDQEDERIKAIHESDLTVTSRRDLKKLVTHSVGNRHTIAFALKGVSRRIASYSYAAKRARIDLPGSADHFNIDAQIAKLANSHARLNARVEVLDQQITDVLTQPTADGEAVRNPGKKRRRPGSLFRKPGRWRNT